MRGDSSGPDFSLEQAARDKGRWPVAGVDEAGRGPWAGPVVAAAVILDPQAIPDGLDDSKKLTAPARERLFGEICASAAYACIAGPVDRIDRDNILAATLWAMAKAVTALAAVPALALVDGNKLPLLPCPGRAVVKGDGLSLSIAAASIIAKVSRDKIMADLAAEHPGYGWERNKGYGTREHAEALSRLGPTPHHRRSFKPIRQLEPQI
jgi:ribonuclease HII